MGRRGAAAAGAGAGPQPTLQLLQLPDGALHSIIDAAEELCPLSSTCRQLCKAVRAHKPTCLVISNEGAALLLNSRSAPFSGVTQLKLRVEDAEQLSRATSLLQKAAHTMPRVQALKLRLDRKTIYLDGGEPSVWSRTEEDETFMEEEACLVGPLSVVGRLQHLVALDLSTPLLGHPSAVALAALTQLTHLCLCETEHLNYQDKYSRWPLTELVQLSQLRSLQLTGYSHPYGLLEGGVLCLPTGLQKVVLDGCGHPTVWLPHVCECPQLQHLTLSVNRQGAHVSLHPAAVVALAHKHWPHLTQLQFQGPVFRGDEDRRWTWYGDDVPVAPPVPSAWQPDVNLAGMQHLQMLHTVAYEPLAISSPDHWLLLGQLPQLHTITGARITCAPPAGLQLGALRVLSQCTVKLEGADLGRVLAACQGLTSAELVVEWVTPPPNPPSGATAAEALAAASGGSAAAAAGRGGGRAAAAAAGAVASARTSKYEQLSQAGGDSNQQPRLQLKLAYPWKHTGTPVTCATAPAAAAHWRDLCGSLNSLDTLDLVWPPTTSRVKEALLPALSGFTHLRVLRLMQARAPSNLRPGLQQVHVEDLLEVLQGVTGCLQELELADLPFISPRVALVLQEHLPRLRKVTLSGCACLVAGRGKDGESGSWCRWSDGPRLARLRRYLRPGLQVVVPADKTPY